MAFLLLLLANGIFTLILLYALHIVRGDIKRTKKETQEIKARLHWIKVRQLKK